MRVESAEEFERICCSGEAEAPYNSAKVEADEDIWLDVINNFPDLRKSVVSNQNVPLSVLEALLDVDPTFRWRIATKRRLSREIFERLSQDADSGVRQALAGNAKVPQDILDRLSEDSDPYVRQEARDEVARRMAGGTKPW